MNLKHWWNDYKLPFAEIVIDYAGQRACWKKTMRAYNHAVERNTVSSASERDAEDYIIENRRPHQKVAEQPIRYEFI